MQYAPYGLELENVPNVIVDGRGNDATVLVLSHWPGNATPPELKADTSTEIVINYLRSAKRDEYIAGAEAVSNNHYDIDGLMGIWALLNPEQALDRAELLIAIGECGDFSRWSGEQATKITCALNGLETLPSSPIAQGAAQTGDQDASVAHRYREMLTLLPELIDDIEQFEDYWRDEFRRVEEGRALFASGGVTVQETPELDFAEFHLPHDVHDMALYEQTQCSRVAIIIEDGQHYQARYRYESWVELQSRRPPPRINMQPFAAFLESFEGNEGVWTADDVQSILPTLGLHGPEGAMSSSSLTPGLFVRMFMKFLRENEDNQALLWSPYSADADDVSVLTSD